jgi:hypothetical protein
VIVLDENVFESQRLQLRSWRIHLCQIGQDVGRKGMQDDAIITLLRTLRRPSFFSRDRDFFKKTLCSDNYCLAYFDVGPLEVAQYARRLLRHPDFKSWSQRQGSVARIAASGISVWHAHAARLVRYPWVN